MKLKYYLRGVGIGIIFATLVLTVSSIVHVNNPSKETIIKEAKKLGMIMPESTEDTEGGLFTSEDESLLENDTSGTEVGSEENNTESEGVSESENSSESQVQEGTLVTITIKKGDFARQVAQTLYDNGLVPDAEGFRVYLGEKGYGSGIRVGTFQIPMGATFEEICDVIINK